MNGTFDIELTETLRDIADEFGPVPADLAAVALRGSQVRRRRSLVTAVAVVVAMAAAVTPAVLVTRHPHATTHLASHERITNVEVYLPSGNVQQASALLQKRFAGAGITVRSVSIDPGTASDPGTAIRFQLGSTLSTDLMQDELDQLTAPGSLQFRTVSASMAMPRLTPEDLDWATRALAKTPTLASVKAKLGAAYTYAEALTGPAKLDAATRAHLAPFALLTWSEVALLPARIQYDVPTINCAQLVDPETSPPTVAPAGSEIVTCNQQTESGLRTKYLLEAAQLTNADIASAKATADPVVWALTVTFTAGGELKWADLTNRLSASHQQMAIVTDSTILAVPQIDSPMRSSVTFEADDPGFTKVSAADLALVINSGPLPAPFTLPVYLMVQPSPGPSPK
jgi:hypothetical protein